MDRVNHVRFQYSLGPKVTAAYYFARAAHAGQTRKYTGEPYIEHPISVAHMINDRGYPASMICAALLHDVVEDTPVTIHDIFDLFGEEVGTLVCYLTDVSKPEDGNRAIRKELDRANISQGTPGAKTIKLADLIDNSRSIQKHDPDFATVYMREKSLLLSVLTEGDKTLYTEAREIVRDYYDRGNHGCVENDLGRPNRYYSGGMCVTKQKET